MEAASRRGESAPQCGGTIPGTGDRPAFTRWNSERAPLPVVLAVPHAGRDYPPDVIGQMRHPAEASLRLEDRFVDRLAQAVARETGAALLVAHAPRALIDLNRAPDDIDWDMVAGAGPERRGGLAAGRRARSGLGLVPRRLAGLGELWRQRLTMADLEARLAGIHRPYHDALARTLERLRDRWGAALLIDLHSMPPLGPKRGHGAAPDFVIGDRFGSSCDAALSAAALAYFAAAGHGAAHNRPYAGGYALDRHAAPARGLHAVQVEVCRAAYLDPSMRETGPGLTPVVAVLSGLVRRLAAELAGDLAAGRGLPQAAE
ncbi:MAG: N-formylglutamate amidohydrolase [Croceibacterium sp.]